MERTPCLIVSHHHCLISLIFSSMMSVAFSTPCPSSASSSPDDQGSALDRGDLGAEFLQLQQVVGRQLVRLVRVGLAGQPAVISRGGGGAAAAAAAFCRALQTDAFGSLHHRPQLQHQRVGHQLLRSALAGNFGFEGEDGRPGKHLGTGQTPVKPLTFTFILVESTQNGRSVDSSMTYKLASYLHQIVFLRSTGSLGYFL